MRIPPAGGSIVSMAIAGFVSATLLNRQRFLVLFLPTSSIVASAVLSPIGIIATLRHRYSQIVDNCG